MHMLGEGAPTHPGQKERKKERKKGQRSAEQLRKN
jgi:hypothetical protein